ncbi:hypothetical protein KAI52_03435 [Candidatus Parcubacteria bacterium]|nr:hypothetical protein [Candidatus Parcubacteria bacterium]
MRSLKILSFFVISLSFVSVVFANNFFLSSQMKEDILGYKPNKCTTVQRIVGNPALYQPKRFSDIFLIPVAVQTVTTFVTENRIDFAIILQKKNGEWKFFKTQTRQQILSRFAKDDLYEESELDDLLNKSVGF